jgi:hypothetical protein
MFQLWKKNIIVHSPLEGAASTNADNIQECDGEDAGEDDEVVHDEKAQPAVVSLGDCAGLY